MTEDGRTYREGDNMTLNGSQVPKSGDVVLVVSQRSCNHEIPDRLAKVVSQVDKAMRAEGLNNNRYRYVTLPVINVQLIHIRSFCHNIMKAVMPPFLALSIYTGIETNMYLFLFRRTRSHLALVFAFAMIFSDVCRYSHRWV